MLLAAAKTDQEIQQDVLRELRWDSRVDETEIGVEVDAGVVTLTGSVDSYAGKTAARDAAHRVNGVLDVADDVEVKPLESGRRTDTEIAHAVRFALEWNALLPDQEIRSTISNGWVTLEGEVSTLREKEEAERALRGLEGIRGVGNHLTVGAIRVDPAELRRSIEEALARGAEREARKIGVAVDDGRVTLEGSVRSWREKKTILDTLSHALGVREVRDKLAVAPWA